MCLLVVWLGVSLAVRMVSSGKPTAAGTLALLDAKPGAAASAETRHAWIALFSSHLAVLDLDARHRILMDPRLRSAFVDMSPVDQSRFLQSIETPGLSEFIEGTKGWSVGRYERLIQPALADLEEIKAGATAELEAVLANPPKWRFGEGGIESIFKDAAPLTRFDTRPLIERLQRYSQFGR